MSSKPSLREALDASLDRLAAGQSISQCLYHYPEHATELRPLLEAATVLWRVDVPEARPEAVEAGYLRMLAAVQTKQLRGEAKRRDEAKRRGDPQGQRAGFLSCLVGRSPQPWRMVGATVVFILALIGLGWLWQAADFSTVVSSVLIDPVRAVVVEADGLVLYLPAGTRTWLPVEAEQVLVAGDRLQTMGAGYAQVRVGPAHTIALAGPAKVMLVAAPTCWSPRVSPSVYQMAGEVRYSVDVADAPAEARRYGVTPALAASPHQETQVSFEVRSPVLAVRAAHAAFVMAVAQDGSTAVAVDEGEVTVTAGDRVQVANKGQTAVVRVANVEDGAGSAVTDLQMLPGGSEALDEAGFGPAELDVVPSAPSEDPDGEGDPDGAPDVPPGLEESDGVPPGQSDKDDEDDEPNTPPGLEDKDDPGVPPGQSDKDDEDDEPTTPPGLEDKGGEPPGQSDKDDEDDEPNTPPGLEDKDDPGVPPGQSDKDDEDDEPTTPPGLEDKGGEPPGQVDDSSVDELPASEVPPGLEDKGGEPPGQSDEGDSDDDPGPPESPPGQDDSGGDQSPPESPPGQEDKDNDPAPPGQGKGRNP